MANLDHLAMLKEGITVWNQWRMESPLTRPELSEADLEHGNLIGANLSGASLEKAELHAADHAVVFVSDTMELCWAAAQTVSEDQDHARKCARHL
jgi:uncharacterized protein YjbI with pentapeptide repeats